MRYHNIMSCMKIDIRPKLLSVQCKLFQNLIRNCLRSTTSYDLSSEDEATYYDLDTKHMILKELRRRSIRANSRSNEHFYALYRTDNYDNIMKKQKEHTDDDCYFGNECESFYSAKTNFSSCSSQGTNIPHRSVIEELNNLDGWPFGLWRRRVVLLPPLPPTPANSWMWLRRNSETKAASFSCGEMHKT